MSESNDTGIVDETKKALTTDAEVPIDKKLPGSTFSLVALSYFVVLIIGALVLAAVVWLFLRPSDSEQLPQAPPAIVSEVSSTALTHLF